MVKEYSYFFVSWKQVGTKIQLSTTASPVYTSPVIWRIFGNRSNDKPSEYNTIDGVSKYYIHRYYKI